MRRAFFLILTFSIFATSANAQNFYHSTRNYTAIDGLPQSQVMAMAEDKNGYLWIGTQGGGLARFDGRTFKVYTTLDGLLANQVIGLEFDHDDNLWIAHPKGVTKYDGLTFKQFKAGGAQGVRALRRVYNVNDTIFVLGHGLVTKIHNDSVYYWDKNIFNDRVVWRAHQSKEGQIYFYLSDSTIVVWSAEKSSMVALPEETGRIRNMFDYKNEIVLQTANGVFGLDSKLGRVEKLPWKFRGHVLTYDEKEDEFWTMDENTLYKEKLEDGVFECRTILNDVFIRQVLLDSEGNAWLASDGRGLYKYFIQDFIKCSSENMRSVMAVTRDHDGTTWIGTIGKGLWSIKKGKTNHYDTKNAKTLYRNNIQCLKEAPDGTLWVGTGQGLGKYNRDSDTFRWYTRADGLAGDGIVCIDFDENGMWVGTGNGLSYYDGTKFTTYNQDNGLASKMIYAIHYLKKYKTLYVGTEAAINTYKNGKVGTISIPEMANTTVLSLHTYKDSLLVIGTSGAGVVILNPGTGQRKSLTTRDGMASDFVYFVGVDERDYLWIGTEKGISHVKLGDRHDVVENLHFGYDNGLVGVETNQNAYYLSPTIKYFGLVDGVYQFNDLSNERLGSFDIHLTDVQILYGEYSPRDYSDSTYSFFKIPSKPVLPPDKNHLTFQFNRVDKQYSNSVKYKYLMENFDKTWSLPSSTNEVTYSNLPPGDYVFRVMSTDSKGSWSEAQIVYPFSIRPPFYKTASFIVGVLIFAGGLITLVMYIRVKQRVNRIVILERIRQREQEALRKEIARDFHDEMGNQLTRIINYVSLLKMNGNGNGNGNGHDLYAKVENSAKYLYTGTRDFIWAIDPVNDDLAKLFLHIRDFGEKLFDEKNISFRAINKVMEDQKLPYGFSREANLIFKEAMTNSFKSSCARNVTLSMKKGERGNFELSLEDDGVGFNPGDVENSNGLKNIRERANRINSVLRIHSVKNEGTKIVLSFTLTKTMKYGIAF